MSFRRKIAVNISFAFYEKLEKGINNDGRDFKLNLNFSVRTNYFDF